MARRKKKAAHSMGEAEAPEEKLDTSYPGSLRRVADAIREAIAWDQPTAADILDEEADLLDPPAEEEEDEETAPPA
jgi:hypothetical protein